MQALKEAIGKVTVYRFDIFKGEVDQTGKVHKVKSVGSSYIREGLNTYTVHLKTFLKDTFYLIQNTRLPGPDFVILSREASQNPKRKYYWNNIGEGVCLDGENKGIMKLTWDVLPDLYMKVEPISVTEAQDQETQQTQPEQAA